VPWTDSNSYNLGATDGCEIRQVQKGGANISCNKIFKNFHIDIYLHIQDTYLKKIYANKIVKYTLHIKYGI